MTLFFFTRPFFWLLILFIATGVYFKSSAPTTCPWLSENERIFVLTGDVRRIPFAKTLLERHPRRHLYIIGVGGDFTAMIPTDKRPMITTESESRTTYENALAIREIATAQNLNRFAIVTTEDHMPRAMLLVRRRMPDANIIPCPVPLHGMPAPQRLERWAIEYLKYIGTVLGVESRK